MIDTDLRKAVERLVDRQAILDCLAAYARGVDRHDRELLLSAYHDDAQDDHGVFCGTAPAFADWIFDLQSAHQLRHHHYIVNHSCELDGDVAHTETYYLFAGVNREGPPTLSGGRYVDRFERRAGRWAIAARRCLIEWTCSMAETDFPAEYLAALESGGTVARDRSDTSYERPLRVTSPHRVFSF